MLELCRRLAASSSSTRSSCARRRTSASADPEDDLVVDIEDRIDEALDELEGALQARRRVRS